MAAVMANVHFAAPRGAEANLCRQVLSDPPAKGKAVDDSRTLSTLSDLGLEPTLQDFEDDYHESELLSDHTPRQCEGEIGRAPCKAARRLLEASRYAKVQKKEMQRVNAISDQKTWDDLMQGARAILDSGELDDESDEEYEVEALAEMAPEGSLAARLMCEHISEKDAQQNATLASRQNASLGNSYGELQRVHAISDQNEWKRLLDGAFSILENGELSESDDEVTPRSEGSLASRITMTQGMQRVNAISDQDEWARLIVGARTLMDSEEFGDDEELGHLFTSEMTTAVPSSEGADGVESITSDAESQRTVPGSKVEQPNAGEKMDQAAWTKMILEGRFLPFDGPADSEDEIDEEESQKYEEFKKTKLANVNFAYEFEWTESAYVSTGSSISKQMKLEAPAGSPSTFRSNLRQSRFSSSRSAPGAVDPTGKTRSPKTRYELRRAGTVGACVSA